MVSVCIAALLKPAGGWRRLPIVALSTVAIYGLVFLGLFFARNDFSRGVVIAVFVSAIVLVTAPYLLPASRLLRVLALGVLLAPLALNQIAPDLAPRFVERLFPESTSTIVKSSYYNLTFDVRQGPRSAVHGGALGRIGDRQLLLTGDGGLYLFGSISDKEEPAFTRLPYKVPINGDEFSAAAGRPWATAREEQLETAHNAGPEILNAENFRTYGLLVQEIGADVRVFVSHAYWYAEQACFVERVSMLVADRAAFFRGEPGPAWKTLY